MQACYLAGHDKNECAGSRVINYESQPQLLGSLSNGLLLVGAAEDDWDVHILGDLVTIAQYAWRIYNDSLLDSNAHNGL